MRRNYVIAAMLASGLAFAQDPVKAPEAQAQLEVFDGVDKLDGVGPIFIDGKETTIWSEDFGSGIPSGWTNTGFTGTGAPSSNALWEYRGPNTNPDNTVGSRGQFSGINNNPPTNQPINSPTAANGFVIFDSDYLDNGGTPNFGSGASPAPHIGTLESGVINLANDPDVIIEFFSYFRTFGSRHFVAFSTDGGTTYPDSIQIAPSVGINDATPRDHRTLANVSSIIGGQSNVRIKFIYEGLNNNGTVDDGYYFWMLDDVAIKTAPHTLFSFERFEVQPGEFAPAYDVLADNPEVYYNFFGGGMIGPAKYGTSTLRENRGIAFDANVRNIGKSPQTNVKLEVEVYRGGSLETTLSTPPVSLLPSMDIAPFSVLTTSFWTPTQKGIYACVFKVSSDSLSLADNSSDNLNEQPDTIFITISDDSWGHDFRRFNNTIGTAQLGDDGSAIAVRYEVVEGVRDQAIGAFLGISTNMQPGGLVEFKLYRNLDLQTGMPPIASGSKTISAADVTNGFVEVDFYDPATNSGHADMEYPSSNPVTALPDSAFWLVAEFFSNSGANPILVRNDRTTEPPLQALMYISDQNTWFSRYTASRNFARPHLRLQTCSSTDACNLSVDRIETNHNIKFFPNPTSGRIMLDFTEAKGQDARITLTDMNGKVVLVEDARTVAGAQHQMDLGRMASGMYIMTIEFGGKKSTYKVSVEK
ncbi:MAG: T9SS type A sorting domain-containing protein [Cryomorphaceae bacterium]|nr:T9SS type A sorting domain-containing protein [Cryomorphaceae bacterium]